MASRCTTTTAPTFSGLCFAVCEPKRMMPSGMKLEVHFQCNLKFDPGASTLDAPPPPLEAQRPPGVEMSSCLPAALVDLLPSASLSACVHRFEWPVVCSSPLFFACTYHFTFLFCLDTSPELPFKTNTFRFTILRTRFCFDMPTGKGQGHDGYY